MAIDWITVSAQIVNFLILVWLLKRFLYQPVLNAMSQREARIASSLREAAEREAAAEESRLRYFEKTQALERDVNRALAQARQEAENEKVNMLELARVEVAERRTAWRAQLHEEKNTFIDKLRHAGAETLTLLSRQMVQDLANADLEQQIVTVFISRLAEVGEQLRERLSESAGDVRVTTTFKLDLSLRQRLEQAIYNQLNSNVTVTFDQSQAPVCGIELNFSGQRVSWNVAEYCRALDERVGKLLDTQLRAEA
jgi:F-type H+-transporting ATPase subunit b